MKAIETKYLGATDTKPSRIKAFANGGNQITISYDHELNQGQAHRKAAQALADKMGWKGRLIGGGTANGYVFVFEHSLI